MSEGYHASEENGCPYSELDELLCEYVDGTMDPTVQRVFEEYLQTDPALCEHVECLRHTRMLLCHYGCRMHAPRDLQGRLRQRLDSELAGGQRPVLGKTADRLRTVVAFTSAAVVMLMVGLQIGATLQGDRHGPMEGQAAQAASITGPQPWQGPAASTPYATSALQEAQSLSAVGSIPGLTSFFRSSVLSPGDSQTTYARLDVQQLQRIDGQP